jgi:glutamine amidotransferase
MAMIAIIDYGMGNLCSVQKAMEYLGAETVITDSPDILSRTDKIVLPGVGAFGDAMRELGSRGLVEPLRRAVALQKPFLGICLGMQVLFDRSEESPGVGGLSILPGEVKRFVTDLKVPHMGWNQICIRRQAPIFRGVEDGAFLYFVHSYYAVPGCAEDIAATTDYAVEFASAICRGRLFGTQFHPEKSQTVGLKILKNFIDLEER